MTNFDPVDAFQVEGTLPPPRVVIDPELLAPEDLVDRLRLWGTRARQVLQTRQGVMAALELELRRLYPEYEIAEAPPAEPLLETMRDEMRFGFGEYIQALEALHEALRTVDGELLEQAMERGEGAEEHLRKLDSAFEEVESILESE